MDLVESKRKRPVPDLQGWPLKSSDYNMLAATLFQQTQAQGIQLNEAGRIALVIGAGIFFESDMLQRIEALRRLAADHGDIALVELQADIAFDMLLRFIDQGLQHLTFGREPEAVIDELGITWHQLVLEMAGAAIEGQALDAAMGGMQDGAAGCFIDAARFHADKTVLHQIQPANAIGLAELVQFGEQGRRRQLLPIERDRVTLQ